MNEVELLENKEKREEMIDIDKYLDVIGSECAKRFIELINSFGEKYFIECCENYVSNNAEISYIYFIYNNTTKLTKIGVTNDLKKRCVKINSDFRNTIGINPNMKLRAIIPCYKAFQYKSEKIVHEMFKEVRKFGEWFDINYKDIMFYNRIYPMRGVNGIIIGDSYLISNIEDIYKYNNLKPFSLGDIMLSVTVAEKLKELANELYKKILERNILYVGLKGENNEIEIKTMNEIINKRGYINKVNLEDRIDFRVICECNKYLCG